MPKSVLSDTVFTETCAFLREQFSSAVLTPGQALSVLPGFMAEDPESAAMQRIQRGTYPFPLRSFSGRKVVLVSDIALTLLDMKPSDAPAVSHPPDPSPAPKRKRGRPRGSVASRSSGANADYPSHPVPDDLTDEQLRAAVVAACHYRSGEDSIGSLYMGGHAHAAVCRALGGSYGHDEISDLVLTASRQQLVTALNGPCNNIYHYMLDHPRGKCACCGSITTLENLEKNDAN